MSVPITSEPVAGRRLRIAITSPDILARIRHVFASKNLTTEVTGLPYVEVTVWPTEAAAADEPAVGSAVRRLSGPAGRAATPPARLCAEYRLTVVEVDDPPTADHQAPPVRRRHLAAVPDCDADDPVPALSPRQREVMAMVSRGACNAEIAAALRISEKTVKNHINRIFRSLRADNRVEAVLAWQHHCPEASRCETAPAAQLSDRPGSAETP